MMKEKILKFLQQQSGFVSGQKICDELGVSRTAVWKYMNSLKKEGYEIESVTRKGYRLLQSPDLLTKESVLGCMPEGILTGELCCFEQIDSTNEEAKRQAEKGAPDGSLYVANHQTHGKGRRGRVWDSPAGKDIFFTLLFRPEIPLDRVSMLTLVTAEAIAAAVEELAEVSCQIKWPNDILLNGKKICGILTEMNMEIDRVAYVVIGAGINVNRTEFEEEISDMATSIRKETGKKVERNLLLAKIIEAFFRNYHMFLQALDMTPFLEDYNRRLVNVGREVKIIRKQEEKICRALGINQRGELLVQNARGETEQICSGEVSVRGIYGYV